MALDQVCVCISACTLPAYWDTVLAIKRLQICHLCAVWFLRELLNSMYKKRKIGMVCENSVILKELQSGKRNTFLWGKNKFCFFFFFFCLTFIWTVGDQLDLKIGGTFLCLVTGIVLFWFGDPLLPLLLYFVCSKDF